MLPKLISNAHEWMNEIHIVPIYSTTLETFRFSMGRDHCNLVKKKERRRKRRSLPSALNVKVMKFKQAQVNVIHCERIAKDVSVDQDTVAMTGNRERVG